MPYLRIRKEASVAQVSGTSGRAVRDRAGARPQGPGRKRSWVYSKSRAMGSGTRVVRSQ